MKKHSLFLIFLILPALIYSQDFNESKKRKKMNKEAPPGTVWLKDNLYFDVDEVRNIDYLEYLFWLKNKQGKKSTEYKDALPDTLVWRRSRLSYNEPYISNYLRHQSFYEFPIVGISPKQALSYCKWRTDRVIEFYLIQNHKITSEDIFDKSKRVMIDSLIDNYKPKIKYRLPTEEEWIFAASANHKNPVFPWEGTDLIDKSGEPKANFFRYQLFLKPGKLNDNSFLTYTGYFEPNGFGIYDMAGNVAEIVSSPDLTKEKYRIKGGSWMQAGFHCLIKLHDNFIYPRNYIGFRCICEVN